MHREYFPGVKRLEHEVDNLSQTSPEVKNNRNCTSTVTGTTFLVLTFTVNNTDYIVSNEGMTGNNVLHAVVIYCTIKQRKANWIGRILGRNCNPRHGIEVKIEGTRRRVRRRKKLLGDLE